VKLSIVTPSYNQGKFIERTIRSVLEQRGDFELEYLVVDGGSTDQTLSILERYRGRLTYVSDRDAGQVDAISKGFARATGEVVAWLNSDDLYLPGALEEVTRALSQPGARWCFGQCRIIDESDAEIRRGIAWYKNRLSRRYSLRRLLTTDFIPQPATFFRRDLLEEAGPLDPSFHYAMDYDLWLRFARVSEPVFIPRDLARFRWHGTSKSSGRYGEAAREAYAAARRHAKPSERLALVEHALHVLCLLTGYGLLQLLESGTRRAPRAPRPSAAAPRAASPHSGGSS
jgi:glycosyltransferase involved in cell wall biosynthesis